MGGDRGAAEGRMLRQSRALAAAQRAKDRIGECYAALERKAKLYEQIGGLLLATAREAG